MKARSLFRWSMAGSKRWIWRRENCCGPCWRFQRRNLVRFRRTPSRWRREWRKEKVFIGNAGGEFPPFRGYVAAFNVNNGKELWRFYTVPRRSFKAIREQSHGSRSQNVDRRMVEDGRWRIDMGRHGLPIRMRNLVYVGRRQWLAMAAGIFVRERTRRIWIISTSLRSSL